MNYYISSYHGWFLKGSPEFHTLKRSLQRHLSLKYIYGIRTRSH